MHAYQHTLKCLAIGIFGVSLVHVLFGVSAEPLLGSAVSDASQVDPNLDSQNRFYGAAFALFGVVFWLCSTDLKRYTTLLKLSLLTFFLAGVARIVSIAVVGWPTTAVIVLLAVEVIGPPIMYLWLRQTIGSTTT